jgi:hypothetical protein
MAINWTEAQVAELVAKVVAEMRADKPATEAAPAGARLNTTAAA